MSAEQLANLRRQFARLSVDGLYASYQGAWQRCKIERNGKPPRAENIQELVQVWKELRKAR